MPPAPHPPDRLAADLRALGLPPGAAVLVHASLRALGPVEGGPAGVLEALRAALGPGGTILVPTHTNHLSEPSHWQHPPAPPDLWDSLRAEMGPFRPAETSGWLMGALSEAVRRAPGARRSDHPHFSFAALGPQAEALLADHALEEGLGERSPLGRLYAADGWVLLLGVDHRVNTSLHLAEHRASWTARTWRETGAPLERDGLKRWVTFRELQVTSEDFGELGRDFAATGQERRGPVGAGEARLMRQRAAVDFAVGWLPAHRG